ncbi:Hpc2-related domain protein [Kalmanozyma brasiliensis GHG001]|uniref:Ubinuclein middle domain-containing protein n=1 Tax=Kalmanozyma brasiliensis (strain GHG001) TaxID=1365824 RepID=V5GF26_KALBG|nr:Hpc2-related domain protein [Kalmanozyma brasiliensis GHG001]EST04607.1 Hpc2-related domain protein [Kalmanozyma brasiliensis GHG001]
MSARPSYADAVNDEDMHPSSAASRVSLANLLGPSGPGSSPYASTPRTSPRKRSSAGESAANLQLPPESGNRSGSSSGQPRRIELSSTSQAASTEAAQTFHDAKEHVAEDVAMADPIEENGREPEDYDHDDDDDDEEDDDDDKATTDAGSASEGEGDDKGEGSSPKDGAKAGGNPSSPSKKRSRRRSPSVPEPVVPLAPKRPTVRINILEARQSGYLINVPELVLAKLQKESHPWAKWYEEQLLEAAEPEPVAAPGRPEVPPGLEGFGGLAKLLEKYPAGEGGPSSAGGAAKKRRRPNDDKYDIGQYDVRDPFVDDSELNIDEPTHFAKPKADGFYVTQGTVELAKAKAMGKGQPLPPSERPKPLSIRDSKVGFAGSLTKLVARKAQQGVELPPMPPTASPSMQLGSLLNSGDPGSPSVGSTSALTNAQRQEGTRDSPIKVDDLDSSSSKLAKKNRYPTEPVDPRLQAAFDDLKRKVDAESFQKAKFPPSLKAPLIETAKLAVMLTEYNENFFNHLPTIFPYNRYTMTKLVKREFFPVHMKFFDELKQEHLDKLGGMIRDSYPQQLADFEAAHKAWMERGEAPKEGEAPQAIKPPKAANGDDAMDVDGPQDGEDENVEPTKRWKWTEEMREEVFTLITIENAMSELRNEKHKLENSTEQYSEINARKACYKQMAELFPEDGWTTSTNISREYAQIKKKKDRQEARGEELFGDSRASSVGPA